MRTFGYTLSTNFKIQLFGRSINKTQLNMSIFVIMHKGIIHNGIYFMNEEKARNWIKFKYPKKRFKEPQKNVFICSYYGTKFEIKEIVPNEK